MKTKTEIAEMFNVTTKTVENWISKGMPFYKVGGTIRYEENEVLEWFKDRSEKEKDMQFECANCIKYDTCKDKHNPDCLEPTNGYA